MQSYSHYFARARYKSSLSAMKPVTYSEEAGKGLEVADEVIDGAGDDVHGLELCGDDAQ